MHGKKKFKLHKMKKLFTTCVLLTLTVLHVAAQKVSVKWELGDIDHLESAVITGDETYTSLLSTSYAQGSMIAQVTAMTGSNADEGYSLRTHLPHEWNRRRQATISLLAFNQLPAIS